MAGKRRFTVKKLFITIFLILIIPFIYSGTTSLLSQTELDSPSSITESFVQDYGSIETNFCPQEDCETILTNFLASAQESIHCALFELNLPKVQQVLLEKSSSIDVKVVTDNDYLDEFDYPFVQEDSWGLMHNKFCIVDSKKISTGSMNPTLNGATKNDNNLLLIESQILAQNYDDEFQEMWSGTFKKGDPVKNSRVMLSETKIQNYFCPEDHCTERIKGELAKAKESIHFMTFSFTSQEISNILLLKKLDNLTIRGVMEARQVTKDSVYQQLLYQGVDVVKDQNKQNMHHKVFIIDGKTVITGSMNPTGGGNTRNDENILIIEDENIAQLFLKEWERVYG
ncbi:MAG: phospholipase D-like domain-containing protein [archaeon]|nr:phospholipase D-like domain-containing protein [archaeon]